MNIRASDSSRNRGGLEGKVGDWARGIGRERRGGTGAAEICRGDEIVYPRCVVHVEQK